MDCNATPRPRASAAPSAGPQKLLCKIEIRIHAVLPAVSAILKSYCATPPPPASGRQQHLAPDFTAIIRHYPRLPASPAPTPPPVPDLARALSPAINENKPTIGIIARSPAIRPGRRPSPPIRNYRRFPIAHWLHSKHQKGPESTGFGPLAAPLFGAELCRFNADLVSLTRGFQNWCRESAGAVEEMVAAFRRG